ncbi:DciA family protein [Tepidiphilus succinatimandens]|uniref:DciA family protein n=1 Tax=Tepidiphilus succinatimandens TaxID=224436 RepID=UPI00112F01B5|nr:DciA family protein [Tepidiphilus succinatimandens]
MTRKLGELFRLSAELEPLRHHAMTLQRLQEEIDRLLEEEFRGRVSVANLKDGTLYLHTASALAAAKLRHRLPSLTAALAASAPVQAIKLRVRPTNAPASGVAAPRPPRVRTIGPGGRAAIAELCARLAPDSPLRQALERLIERAAMASEQRQEGDPLERKEAEIDEDDAERKPQDAFGVP